MATCDETFELPDTQPVSQPEEECLSAALVEENYWARLYPAQVTVRFRDLTDSVTLVGRDPTCHITLSDEELSAQMMSIVSKQHFKISRGSNVGSLTLPQVTITDLSFNGTFVNGHRLKKGECMPLNHNDLIGLGRAQYHVFYYLENRKFPSLSSPLQNCYDVSVTLGRGAFGEVSLVFSKKSGRAYAMKTIIKANIWNDRKLDAEIKKLEKEYCILRALKHPNVIQLIDVVDCTRDKFLILELMQGRDLHERIINNKKLTEAQSKLYFYQIVSGVEYLHSQGIIHRDLKPENVLLVDQNIETVLKISDFGLSKILRSDSYMTSLCGTKMYVAPEVLIAGGSEEYTEQVDVWSMGVILFVCLVGELPFNPGREDLTLDDQIKSGQFELSSVLWWYISKSAKNLVKQMMTVNPKRRITLKSILEHAWLSDSEMRFKVKELISKHSSFDNDKENSFPSPIPATMDCVMSPPRKKNKIE